ncbi:MAG: hypothetical protein ACREJD_13610 [Phycisphaerales bacterium]
MSARLAILAALTIGLVTCDQSQGPGHPPAKTPPGSSTSASGFVPSKNGFAFANNFPGAPLPTFLSSSGPTDPKSAFGLCGGMSAAAADYFVAGLALPRERALPERGSTLYEYLFLRQAQSFGPGLATALKFADWTMKPDAELGTLTLRELDTLERALKEHPAVPIGLIIARPNGPPGARNISDNHQVLALAMTREDQVATISIYDPNYPNDDGVKIILGLMSEKQPAGIRNRPKGRSTLIRAVFVLPYEPATPPRANSVTPPQ